MVRETQYCEVRRDGTSLRCSGVAEEQCSNPKCKKWCCHDDETHLIACAGCGRKHCPACHEAHQAGRTCREAA